MVEQVSVVASILGGGVGHAAGERLIAVHEGDESGTGLLAGEMSVDDCGHVGVGVEAVYNSDAGVVDHDHGVGTLVGDSVDQVVRVVVTKAGTVTTLSRKCINEHQTNV